MIRFLDDEKKLKILHYFVLWIFLNALTLGISKQLGTKSECVRGSELTSLAKKSCPPLDEVKKDWSILSQDPNKKGEYTPWYVLCPYMLVKY